MAIYWPTSLIQEPRLDGLTITHGDNLIRSPTETGPGKVRRRQSHAPIDVSCAIYASDTDRGRFQAFYEGTIRDGALRFSWLGLDDTIAGGDRLLNPDPNFTDPSVWPSLGANATFNDFTPTGRVADRQLQVTPPGTTPIYPDATPAQQIPYDPDLTYRGSAWVRRTPGGDGTFYGLFRALDSGRNLIADTSSATGWLGSGSSNVYWAVAEVPPAAGGWAYYEGVFGGNTGVQPPTGTAYLCIGALMNYQSTVGNMFLQGLRFEQTTDTAPRPDGVRTPRYAYQFAAPPSVTPMGVGWQIGLRLLAW